MAGVEVAVEQGARGSLQTRFRHAPEVRYRVIHGEAVVIHVGAREVTGLNPVGTRVFELLARDRTLAEVVADLRAEFHAPPGRIEDEVHEFISQLLEARVITAVEDARP